MMVFLSSTSKGKCLKWQTSVILIATETNSRIGMGPSSGQYGELLVELSGQIFLTKRKGKQVHI